MIKFFRKIRQSLLSEGKTGKYLKYAIGEIILVVIGILIALSINNWNENRKERYAEIEILKELNENLNQDIVNLETRISVNTEYITANKKVLSHLEKRTMLTDSLKRQYALLGAFSTFRPITAGYVNLKSKGVDIIQNKELRNAITTLYDYQYFYFVEDVIYAIDNFRNNKESYIGKRVHFEENVRHFSSRPISLESLYNDEVFKGYLKSSIVLQNWMNRRRSDGILQIEEVIQRIKDQLEK
tara:strand:- start:2014 stop:2739 length:726 start_codon:yes stop_codon:yes gene_type:complete